jgi:hypothetical protein
VTYQECIWKDRFVWVVGWVAKSGRLHPHVVPYVGCAGYVVREAKNGMLIVRFNEKEDLSIPAGCLKPVSEARWAFR